MSWEITMATMLAITAGAAVFVAWPLLAGGGRPEEFFGTEPGEPVLQQLLFQRDTVYAAMKELEFDLATGKLSQQDFNQLHERYKRKAVAILKRIDDARAGRLVASRRRDEDDEYDGGLAPEPSYRAPRDAAGDIDLDLEQEIAAFRKGSRQGKGQRRDAPASRRTRGVSSAPRQSCPACGHSVADPEAQFCSRCGALLRNGKPPRGPRGERHG